MKYFISIVSIVLVSFLFSCSILKKDALIKENTEESNQFIIHPGPPIIKFENAYHDFGDLVKGEIKTHIFKFRNIGTETLIIEIATGCDCTTIDYPSLPILSGKTGEIKISFNSSKKEIGHSDVDIDVIANTYPIVTTAQFVANIIAP